MPNISTAARSGSAASYSTLIEADAGPASWRFYTAGFGALLCTVPLQEPAFSEAGGVLTLRETPSSPSALCAAAGTVGSWEIVDGNGTRVIDDTSFGGINKLSIDNAVVAIGTPITLQGITLTVPASS